MSAFCKFFEDKAASLWRDWIPTPGLHPSESAADFIRYARECFDEMQYADVEFQMDMFGDLSK